MKLDASFFRYLSKDHYRVLTALEAGMRNHDLVPSPLISALACQAHVSSAAAVTKVLLDLLRHKLIVHEVKGYDGYRLTYPGLDVLALRWLVTHDHISGIGRQIGTGKESDIFVVQNAEGEHLALKLQRLGRVSFRAIKRKRDYLGHRRSANWMYMSRLASLKEFSFMKALYDAGFPTPTPIACNRHAVVMSLAPGITLSGVRSLENPASVFERLMDIIMRLAKCGLVHCDFNEFNIMYDEDTDAITMIDFPQMVSTSHPHADELFDRDVRCVRLFFERRFGYVPPSFPTFASIGAKTRDLDIAVQASGFTDEHWRTFDEMLAERTVEEEEEEEDSDSEEGGHHGADHPSAGAGTGASAETGSTTALDAAADAASNRVDDAIVSLSAEAVAEASEGTDAPTHGGSVSDAADLLSAIHISRDAAAIAAAERVEADAVAAAATERGGDAEEGAEASEDSDSEEEDSEEESGDDTTPGRHRAAFDAAEAAKYGISTDGLRTRANGGRVSRGRGGEAYLNAVAEKARKRHGEAPEEEIVAGVTPTDVRTRVKHVFEKRTRAQILGSATHKGTKAANRMKGRELNKIRDAMRTSDGW